MEIFISDLVSLLKKYASHMQESRAFLLLEDGKNESGSLTYHELDSKARVIAAYLQEKKLSSERVLLVYPPGLDFVAAFLGCLYAGVVAVPMNRPGAGEIEKSKHLIETIIHDANVTAVLTTTALNQSFFEKNLPLTIEILETTSFEDHPVSVYTPIKIKSDTIAYLQYTSGSTSLPKAAIITHGMLFHNIKQSSKIWQYTKNSVTVTWAPPTHVYGLVCGLLVPIYNGSLTIIIPPENVIRQPLSWLHAITKYKATHSGAPNFAYELCINEIKNEDLINLSLESWQVAVNGGENVKYETLMRFTNKFSAYGFSIQDFCAAYGMSELTGTIAASPYQKGPRFLKVSLDTIKNNKIKILTEENQPAINLVSYGRVLPGLDVKIIDPEKLIAAQADEIGEIWIRGNSLVSGYWQRSKETRDVFNLKYPGSRHLYFRTGDLGFLNKKELFITGRLKDVINIYGKKYYPVDFEASVIEPLSKFPVTSNRVAIPASIEGKEEVIFIQEIKEKVSAAQIEGMIQTIRKTIAETQGVDLFGVYLVKENSLPKTVSGKLQRKLCQQLYYENKLNIIKKHVKQIVSPHDNYLAEDSLAKTLESKLKSQKDLQKVFQKEFIAIISTTLKVNQDEIDLHKPLSVYGFDSLSIVKLISELNTRYELVITPAVLFEYPTLQEFTIDILKKHEDTFINHYKKIMGASDHDVKSRDHRSPLRDHQDDEQVSNLLKNINANDIAIIGMSGMFPNAPDIDVFWENLVKGKNAISEIPSSRWDWKKYYGDHKENPNKTKIKWGGFIKNATEFDAEFFNISPREAELTDPQQRLFLQTVWKTIEDAGYSTARLSTLKTGLFVGVFKSDYAELLQKNDITDAYVTTGVTHSILANRISYLLNLHGPSEAIDTACSSSLVAIHNAVRAIHDGDCEIAIAGGVNLLLSPTSYLDANKAGMLSEDGRCKTFDKAANGYVRGEGVAAILLKPFNQAVADGDHIYGIVKGTAVNHGGHVSSLTAPNPNAQADVIAAAFRRGNIDVDSVNYIEAHGTGTSLGDPIEINGLQKAFNMLRLEQGKAEIEYSYCGLGAVKTNIGHLEAAAGMAGVIKVLLAMKHQLIPGNIHFEEQNPYINLENSPFYIIDQTQPWLPIKDHEQADLPRRAGVSSFGFGGTNAHIVLEEPPKMIKEHALIDDYPCILTLSAKTDKALNLHIKNLHDWLLKHKEKPSLAALSYTLNIGRAHFEKRCAFIVSSIQELTAALQLLTQNEIPENFIRNTQPENKERIRQIYNGLSDIIFKDILEKILPVDEYRNRLLIVGNLYTEGFDLNWEELHQGEKKRISLPTYPFADDHYWIPQSKLPQIDAAIIEKNINVEKSLEKELGDPSPINAKKSELSSEELRVLVENNFIEAVSSLLKISKDKLSLTASLSELGFDSISFKELAVKLEQLYKIEINPTLFFTYNSIQSLSQYILNEHAENITNSIKEVKSVAMPVPQLTKKVVNHSSPIAIIGMQGYFPQSKDVQAFWQHLVDGDDLITEIPAERWAWQNYYGDAKAQPNKSNSKWGGFIADFDKFDANFFNISAREANLMDPQHRLFMEIVWKTIEDAGYDPFSLSGQPIGVFAGVEFSEYQTLIQSRREIFHGHLATGTSHALLANRISYFLDFHGPSEVIDTACSSALVAMHTAINALRQGDCSLAIAGGVSLILNPDTLIITSQLGALSSDGRCKTFDKSANGYVKGEGVGAVLLKPLADAIEDGDFIYGVVKGSAVNHGGKAQSLTAPNAAAQSQLLINAYEQAQIDPQTVTYIETHGTGTELGDPIEIEGLKKAFSVLNDNQHEMKPFQCGLGSVKTNIGHLEPASGIASVIKVLLAMKYKKLPGILHLNEINPFIDLKNSPFYIVDKTMDWKNLTDDEGKKIPLRAGVSSFGFGGTYAHLILEEGIAQPEKLLMKPSYLITLSAKQEVSLKQKWIDLANWLEKNSEINLEALSFTLNTGRSHFHHRCALVVDTPTELLHSLKALIQGEKIQNGKLSSDHATQNLATQEQVDHLFLDLKNVMDLNHNAYKDNLLLLADAYVNKLSIDWKLFFDTEKIIRVPSVPTYPFLKERYWFDQSINLPISPLSTVNPAVPNNESIKKELDTFAITYLKQVFSQKIQIDAKTISADDTYEVYGVDSLIGLEITEQLEKDFGHIPKTILYEKNKISDLAQFLVKHFPEKLQDKLAVRNGSLRPENSSDDSAPATAIFPKEQAVSASIPQSPSSDSIAIIGLSGTFPQAQNITEFWDNLIQGKDCITHVPSDRWNPKEYPVLIGGVEKIYDKGGFIPDVDKFDPLFFGIAPREASLMDPQERLFMQSAWSTLEDSGYTREKLQQTTHNQIGVFAGVTYNFYPLFIAEEWAKGNRLPLDVQLFSVANRISYFLNLNGPSFIVDTACSSSLAAIHEACESLRRDECKMALAGGVNLSLHPSKYHFLGGYGFLSDQGYCASFAEGGSGYIPGEGFGSVLLKPLADAVRDNDHIYGVILSSSMNHGGKTSGYTVPNPNAQADLIKMALNKANIDPRTISYIEAHGTGTSLGDPIEVRGLQEAFEEKTQEKQFCAIGSVKSNIGHLESAAGISQLTKVLLQFQHQKLVPSIHSEKLNPFIDFNHSPFYVQKELSEWKTHDNNPRRAGISSFGAGGTNIHLIVEEYISTSPANKMIFKPFLFLLSAATSERLQEYAKIYLSFLKKEEKHFANEEQRDEWLTQICYTSQVGRESMAYRLAIKATDFNDLLNKLEKVITQPEQSFADVWLSTAGQKPVIVDNLSALFEQKQYTPILESWISGEKIHWANMYGDQTPRKTYLPTYPFAKRHCWITSTTLVEKNSAIKPSEPEKNPSVVEQLISLSDQVNKPPHSIDDWLYSVVWKNTELTQDKNFIDDNSRWLVFSDNEFGLALQEDLGKNNCIYCFKGTVFNKYSENIYYVNPDRKSDFEQFFSNTLKSQDQSIKGIIYCWSAETQTIKDASNQLFILYKALSKQHLNTKVLMCVVSRGSQAIIDSEMIDLNSHGIWALSRTFSLENPNHPLLLVDLDSAKQLQHEAKRVISEIVNYQSEDNHIAYRDNQRYALRLNQNQFSQSRKNKIEWPALDTVLITGGAGEIGAELVKWLTSKGTKNFILTGRSNLINNPTLDVADESLVNKQNNLKRINELGIQVKYIQMDVRNKAGMQQAIADVEREWKKSIQGVFHLAGLSTANSPIESMTQDYFNEIVSVKRDGALVLHELFQQQELRCFILFASISAVPSFGLSGLSAEAVASEFLNGLALYRRKNKLPAQCIEWSAWSEIGMAAKHQHGKFLEAVGLSPITTKWGIELLESVMQMPSEVIAILKISWKKFLQISPDARKNQFFSQVILPQEEMVEMPSRPVLDAAAVTDLLTTLLANTLELSAAEIDPDLPYQNYGMDSIIGINFVTKISEHFPDILSPMDLYRYPTLNQLIQFIIETTHPAPVDNNSTAQVDKTDVTDLDESQFLAEIANLSEEEVRLQLEAELKELDEMP